MTQPSEELREIEERLERIEEALGMRTVEAQGQPDLEEMHAAFAQRARDGRTR